MEELPDQRLLIGVAVGLRAVLWRVGGGGYPLAVHLTHGLHIVFERLPHGRIDVLPHKFEVAGILIVLPDVLEDPGHTCRAPAPVKAPARAGPAEGGVLGMRRKAVFGVFRRGLHAAVDLGCHTARRAHTVHIGNERQGALRQVGGVGRPVIHLQVDVDMIVRRPRRIIVADPKSLQVGRQGIAAAGGDQQVAAILVKQHLQQALFLRRKRIRLIPRKQRGGRFFGLALPEIQLHTIHHAGYVRRMRCAQSGKALCRRRVHHGLHACVKRLL